MGDKPNNPIVLPVDKPEAKGTVILEPCAYGFYVFIKELSETEPIALIDLFYQSDEWRKDKDKNFDEPYQLLIYPVSDGDEIVIAKFRQRRTNIFVSHYYVSVKDKDFGKEFEYENS